MKFIADFHIHSHFSRATSQELTPEYLDYWAQLKGITVIGTGDFTHPGWIKELQEKLEPAEYGLFRLKKNTPIPTKLDTHSLPHREVRFILTTEISNIYKKNGRVRKVHNVLFAPDFETVERIRLKLTSLHANLTSDGRPILGLDSRDLLEIALEASPQIFFVPAHIWTPWFSVLGDKSGFDTIAQCFDDLAPYIYAVETGLSTDPPMNWMCRFLDPYTLIANSDAHSPEKLGRNANRFHTELNYEAIIAAMKTHDPNQFLGTIDLFPQEGKYHYDGHRKCGICWNPVQTLQNNRLCPVCHHPVTVGVMYRVVELSDRENLSERPNRHQFTSIIPLKEMLGELANVGPNSRQVEHSYINLMKKGLPELELLLETPISDIEKLGGDNLAEAIQRMRNREVYIREGFDGEFGVIKVFHENEKTGPHPKSQNSLFKDFFHPARPLPPPRQLINFNLQEYRHLQQLLLQNQDSSPGSKKPGNPGTTNLLSPLKNLNIYQQAAAQHGPGPALVIAGPGTGKTRVLTARIEYLINSLGVAPTNILAMTFTNKAADEITQRLTSILKKPPKNKNTDKKKPLPPVMTFHALGYTILKEQATILNEPTDTGFSILDPSDKKQVLLQLDGVAANQAARVAKELENAKQLLKTFADINQDDPGLAIIFQRYQEFLHSRHLYDLEDLLYHVVFLLQRHPLILKSYQERFQWILIDEYQDINYSQYCLVRLLMPHAQANLCVIGDPDQAIYQFRGADVRFIQQFQEHYPQAHIYHLNQSYRCPDSILRASGNIMQRPASPENALKGIETGVKIKLVNNATDKSEAEYVARTIEQMMGGLRFFSMDSHISEGHKQAEIESLSDFVVLCRIKNQVQALEKSFQDHTIPYRVIGEEPFFKQEPVCSIIDVLKLAINPGNTFLMEKLATKNQTGKNQVKHDISRPLAMDSLTHIIKQQQSVKGMVLKITETYFPEAEIANLDEVKRLLEMAETFQGDVPGFLQAVSLGTAADTYRPDLENVTIMTLHAAKGLEFMAVFIVGCEDGLLPYGLFKDQQSDIEEEQRLLYVGMTRAKKYLFLCHAQRRLLMNREYELPRSPFLDRIERQLIEMEQQEKKKEIKVPVQRRLFDW